MSDEVKPQGDSSTETPGQIKPEAFNELKSMIEALGQSVVNLKAEMGRKIEQVRPTPPPTPKPKLSEMIYEDPEGAIEQITQTVTQSVSSVFESREKNRQMVSQLYKDYPELEDPSHPLSQAAQVKYASLPPEEKLDSKALRSAVFEAAAEMGLAPKPKRKTAVQPSDEESFSLGGKSGGRRQGGSRKEQVSDVTLETAALMGLDVNDPKVLERIQARSKRNYGKYEG